MKKLKLKLDGNGMLSKQQMKAITGGYSIPCQKLLKCGCGEVMIQLTCSDGDCYIGNEFIACSGNVVRYDDICQMQCS